jgi:hypothetical protein
MSTIQTPMDDVREEVLRSSSRLTDQLDDSDKKAGEE